MGHDDAAMNADAVVRHGLSRREMLQRSGFVVGAAALWATPIVQTVGMRPAAATGIVTNLCEDGKPATITYRFDPADCGQDPHPDDQPTNLPGVDSNGGPNVIDVVGTCTDMSTFSTTNYTFYYSVAESTGGLADTITDAGASEIVPGGFISSPEGSGNSGVVPNIYFRIFAVPTGEGDTLTQTFGFHQSCSSPLEIGYRFASVVVEDFTPR